MKNLAIIPARKGSKGVPDKNIRELGGQPMIAYTVNAAQQSGIFDEIHVSTDSLEIAAAVEEYGIKVRNLRPEHLAGDKTPMLEVIQYVLSLYRNQNIQFDTVTLLQPTAPFRTSEDILKSHKIFSSGNYDSLISVKKVPDHFNPYWVYVQSEEGLRLFSGDQQPVARRQDLPSAYIREGSVYIFKPETVAKYKNIYGEKIASYIVERTTANIDTMEDFENAQKLLIAQQDAEKNS